MRRIPRPRGDYNDPLYRASLAYWLRFIKGTPGGLRSDPGYRAWFSGVYRRTWGGRLARTNRAETMRATMARPCDNEGCGHPMAKHAHRKLRCSECACGLFADPSPRQLREMIEGSRP